MIVSLLKAAKYVRILPTTDEVVDMYIGRS